MLNTHMRVLMGSPNSSLIARYPGFGPPHS